MLVNFFARSKFRKYLSKNANVVSFFSNNTLSLRREALYDIGLYDTQVAKYSEDVDLCLRMHISKWSMFHHKNIILRHRARPTFKKMIEQWWHYGWYTSKVHFKSLPIGTAEILWFAPGAAKEDFYRERKLYSFLFYTQNFFTKALIVLSIYFFSNFFFIVSILFWLLKIKVLAIMSFIIALSWFSVYAKRDFESKPNFDLTKSIKLCFTRYMVNSTFLLAGFISGLLSGNIYLPGYIWNREE